MKDIGRIDLMIEQLRIAWHQNPEYELREIIGMAAASVQYAERHTEYVVDDEDLMFGLIELSRSTR